MVRKWVVKWVRGRVGWSRHWRAVGGGRGTRCCEAAWCAQGGRVALAEFESHSRAYRSPSRLSSVRPLRRVPWSLLTILQTRHRHVSYLRDRMPAMQQESPLTSLQHASGGAVGDACAVGCSWDHPLRLDTSYILLIASYINTEVTCIARALVKSPLET